MLTPSSTGKTAIRSLPLAGNEIVSLVQVEQLQNKKNRTTRKQRQTSKQVFIGRNVSFS
jgi:hypothetical protein